VAYTVQGTARAIGVLMSRRRWATSYQQLLNRALIILASQAAKDVPGFACSSSTCSHSGERGIWSPSPTFVSKYSLARPPPPLHLERRPPYDPRRAGQVIDAFNAMCGNLEQPMAS